MSGICNADVKLSPGFGNARTFEMDSTCVDRPLPTGAAGMSGRVTDFSRRPPRGESEQGLGRLPVAACKCKHFNANELFGNDRFIVRSKRHTSLASSTRGTRRSNEVA